MADHPLVDVEIVTPEGGLYSRKGELVVVPGVEGELGVMAKHQPLVSLLAVGETRVHIGDGQIDRFATGIGYVEVLFSQVRIIVDHAEQAEHIDTDRAERARRRAEQRLAQRGDPAAAADIDFFRAEQALRRAENRLKVALRAGK